jgi:glycosyltransferase involved in cell wall biosynthesis
MIVKALVAHRAGGVRRNPGESYHCDTQTGAHCVRAKLAVVVDEAEGWNTWHGRDLRTEPLAVKPWPQVVACLNIWNDRAALEKTLPTWIGHVDALVVFDGPYASTGAKAGSSTDGLEEFLTGAMGGKPMSMVTQKGPWADQHEKRSRLLQSAASLFPDALLFIVDADEYVTHGETLRQTPFCDVGWVTVSSALYTRPYGQPRLVRAQPNLEYKGRHHWLYAGEQLLATHQYGGAVEHRLSRVQLRNERGLGHSPARAKAKKTHAQAQFITESTAATKRGAKSDAAVGAREALRIFACTTYDPGLVGYRLHTALNTTTPHSSVFFRRGGDNPFQGPRQYDVDAEQGFTRQMIADADVVHCHLDYSIPDSLKAHPKRLVIHHHGTMYRKLADWFNLVDSRADIRLVSNLELLSHGKDLHWLPNPVNVARLRRLREQEYQPTGVFRVAHSPSKRALKGTDEFLSAIELLQQKGLAIEAVLIEGQSIGESMRIKATCDAAFDSFWLGIQCSGLEAGAMGLPVIAGDPEVVERYHAQIGECPYTYANDASALALSLERLATDTEYRTTEAQRVSRYVEQWHDDAAVALRYLDLLDGATNWRQGKAVKQKVAA